MILPKDRPDPSQNLFGGYLMEGGAKLSELSLGCKISGTKVA